MRQNSFRIGFRIGFNIGVGIDFGISFKLKLRAGVLKCAWGGSRIAFRIDCCMFRISSRSTLRLVSGLACGWVSNFKLSFRNGFKFSSQNRIQGECAKFVFRNGFKFDSQNGFRLEGLWASSR